MKKSILIALAVAVATCAQGQSELGDNPTEYENPFASLGVYEYVQKQSDGECGKWFLSGKNAEDRYFTIDSYEYSTVRTAKVVVNKDGNFNDVQFCITLDLSDKFKNTDKNYIEISCDVYNDRDNTQYPYMEYELSMGTKSNEAKDLSSLIEKNENKKTYSDKSNHYKLKNSLQVNQDKYLYIQFNCGKNASVFYFGNIIITGYTYDNDNNRVDIFKESYFDISLYLVQFDTKGGDKIDNMYYVVDYPKHYIFDNNLNEMAFLEQQDYNGYIETHLKWNEGCLPTPIREGYNFKYWELDGEKYDSSIKSNDITLTAVWEKNGETSTDIRTSIADNMESNAYVSNNVLYTDEPSNVSVFSAGGVLVKAEHNTTSVDMSDLKKGVYIARVNDKTIKFVR